MTELLKQQKLFNLLIDDPVLFQEFLDNSKESIIILNNNSTISDWNHAIENITGIKKQQALNNPIIDILSELIPKLKNSDELKIRVKRKIDIYTTNQSKSANKMVRFTIKDSSGKTKSLKALILKFKTKQKTGTGIIIKDLSLEKEKEKKELRNEEYLSTIFNNDAIGIAFTKPTGEIIKVNPKFLELTGYTNEEILKLSIKKITHPDDFIKENELFNKTVREKGKKYTIEKRYIRKDGSTICAKLHTNFKWNSDNELELIFGFIEDITSKKKTEKALLESEKKYRYLTEKATDIIYTISLDSKVTFYNKAIERIFESTTEEIEQNNYTHLMLPQDKESALKLHSDIYNGKKPPIFEHGFKTPKGRLVYLECSVTPLFNESNEVTGALGIARDITDKRKAQEELKEGKEVLEDLVKTKDKFLSVIAHDLRDPFNILIGYSDLILSDFENISKEDLKKYIQAINNSSNNSFSLLKNLIDWSKTESNRIVFSPEKINIGKTISRTIQSLKYSAEAKSVKIRFKYIDNIFIYTDDNMLKTVLRNLIANSIKFSYKHSDIVIELIEEKNQFIVKIIDTGSGISDENKARLFLQNHNFSERGTTNEKGSGLGLLICKEFINKWNGRLWIESNLGEGSTFSFSIPK
ncbi:MAG: PAS domain-containing sensor histidine kinase [Bacteroidales bacterium]|nr:PAS domain-containing sensor histidine kinase [Bacteroidales bacterium]